MNNIGTLEVPPTPEILTPLQDFREGIEQVAAENPIATDLCYVTETNQVVSEHQEHGKIIAVSNSGKDFASVKLLAAKELYEKVGTLVSLVTERHKDTDGQKVRKEVKLGYQLVHREIVLNALYSECTSSYRSVGNEKVVNNSGSKRTISNMPADQLNSRLRWILRKFEEVIPD